MDDVAVRELARRDALALGDLGDRLAVLVRAGQEEDLLAALAHVARDDVGGDRRVRVAEMRLGVHVVDRCGYVEAHRRGTIKVERGKEFRPIMGSVRATAERPWLGISFWGEGIAALKKGISLASSRNDRTFPQFAALFARFVAGITLVALAVLAFTAAVANAAISPELKRYPYLTDVVGDSATVNWGTTRLSNQGVLKYGEVGTESCTAHTVATTRIAITVGTVAEYQWKAQLTGLEPNTEYCYRLYLTASSIDLLGRRPVTPLQEPDRRAARAPPTRSPSSATGATSHADGTNPDQANVMQPDRAERRPVRRHDGRQRLPVRQPAQLRRPGPDRRRHERRLRPELLDGRRLARSRSSRDGQPRVLRRDDRAQQLAAGQGRGDLRTAATPRRPTAA